MPAVTATRDKRTFQPPWKEGQTITTSRGTQDPDDFSMSQRWVSPFRARAVALRSSPSGAGATERDAQPAGRDLSSFSRRRLPFGGNATAPTDNVRAYRQGQIASQVLQSIHERSSQQYSDGFPFRQTQTQAPQELVGDVGSDAGVLQRMDALEERLTRIQETMERVVRGLGKYTALATDAIEGKSDAALVQRIAVAVTDSVLRGLEREPDLMDRRGSQDGVARVTRVASVKTGRNRKRRYVQASTRAPSAGSCESCCSR